MQLCSGDDCAARLAAGGCNSSIARQQRRDAPHGDAAIGAFGTQGRDLQELLAVALRNEVLRRHAEGLGLNVGQFQTCLDTGRFAADIKADIADAAKANINGTPTFLIGVVQPNGSVKVMKKLVGARPYADFKAAIDSALAGR